MPNKAKARTAEVPTTALSTAGNAPQSTSGASATKAARNAAAASTSPSASGAGDLPRDQSVIRVGASDEPFDQVALTIIITKPASRSPFAEGFGILCVLANEVPRALQQTGKALIVNRGRVAATVWCRTMPVAQPHVTAAAGVREFPCNTTHKPDTVEQDLVDEPPGETKG